MQRPYFATALESGLRRHRPLVHRHPELGQPDPEAVDERDEEAAAEDDPDRHARVVFPVEDGVDELVAHFNA